MKTCAASNCNYPVFSNLYCKAHQYMRKDDKYDKRSPIQKYYSNLKKAGCVNENGGLIVSKAQDLIEKNNLKEWFAYHMVNSKKVCENCGASLESYGYWNWYSSQHHILEKSLFPSVQYELENHAVLGMWCCHPIWHSSYENAMQMPIWNIAVERVQSILHLVKEKHKILELFKPLNELK